jgi:hypothetical protein
MQHVSDHIQIIWSLVDLRGCASRSFCFQARVDMSGKGSGEPAAGSAIAIQTVRDDCRLDKVYDGRTVFPAMKNANQPKSTDLDLHLKTPTPFQPTSLHQPRNHNTNHPTHLA